MNARQAQELELGIYRLHWLDGSSSLAAVGALQDGRRWFAPINWTSIASLGIACTKWRMVKRAERIVVR